MLIHIEVAMHTNEEKVRPHAHTCERESERVHVCLVDISGCGAHSGGPPKRKMNSSRRVM